MMRILTGLGLVWLLCGAGQSAELLRNPGFETLGANQMPEAWETMVLGSDAQFSLDASSPTNRSARIEAKEMTRAYFRSAPIEVAPGEKIKISARVKVANVPPDKGMVILIADFFVAPEAPVGGPTKVAVAEKTVAGWQTIAGAITVPPGAKLMRLRCGFSYASGVCWWDDFRVQPTHPLALRLELPEGQLRPLGGRLTLSLLNRDGRRESVTARLQVGRQTFERTAVLSGNSLERIQIPVRLPKEGKQSVRVELVSASGAKLFASEEQTVMVPAPITFAPLIPTHWVLEDGEPAFEGELSLVLDEVDPAATFEIRVLDGAHQPRATLRANLHQAAATNVFTFRLRAPGLAAGAYRVVVDIPTAKQNLHAEQPWPIIRRAQAKTTLAENGFPVVGGRLLYPLGMFNNTARIAESAAAGFNLVHMYNAARVQPGRRADDQRLKDLLDATENAGMHCLLLVPMEYAFAGQWEAFTRRIRMFRNHPALLAWDEEEGLARGDLKPAGLQQMRRVLQSEDPHHPFMVGDSRDVITRVTDRSRFFPEDQMDMGMWWWYPFPLKPGQADALEGTEPGGLILEPPSFLVQGTTTKPLWVGVQAYRKPGANGRYPTPAEYRAQAWLGIISGAKGLMWYGASVTGGVFQNPKEGHWDELKTLLTELHSLEPWLLSPNGDTPTLNPPSSSIKAATRTCHGKTILIAVNCGPQPWQGSLQVSALAKTEVQVRGQNRTLPSPQGRIVDTLAAYEVRVYEW